MTAQSSTRSHRAEADIHGVQTDRQAKTRRRRRSSGKDGKQCLITPPNTQSHSQKQSKMAMMSEMKTYHTSVGTVCP